MARSAHLVGSIPLEDAETAMSAALGRLGPHLRTLPDGETGERSDWIIHIVESLRDHPDLEVRDEGQWSDYDDTLTHKVKLGHTLDGRDLDLGHVAAFEDSFPVFERLREELGDDELSLQVGIPSDLDMALFALGPTGPLLHRWPFTVATLREIHAIHRRAGQQVVFQIEMPAELVAVTRTPRPLQPLVAAWLARGIVRLARRAPTGARFGLHLCLGDMNHEALARMRDVRPLVLLTNAIATRWPDRQPLEYVHVPLAAGQLPPPMRREYHAPLAELDLPAQVRLVAGLVHEDRSIDELRELLELVEGLVGRTVDVANACGLGRHEPDQALHAMAQAAVLCRDGDHPSGTG